MSTKRKIETEDTQQIIMRCKSRKMKTQTHHESSVIEDDNWASVSSYLDRMILLEHLDEVLDNFDLSEDEPDANSDLVEEMIKDLEYLDNASFHVEDNKRYIEIMHKVNSGEYPPNFFEETLLDRKVFL